MSTTTNKPETTTITAGTRIKIEKGCKARGIDKGCSAKVTDVQPMGAEYSHCVRVVFMMLNGYKSGKTFAFYARHSNRMSDIVVRMNDGNPSHTIEIVRSYKSC